MATTTFCDWCGELIEESNPLTLRAYGNGQDGSYISTAEFLNYHASKRDPDCCFRQMSKLLHERAAWAHGGHEETRLEWRLVPAARRTEPDGGGNPVGKDWQERTRAGTALYKLDLCAKADYGLRSANVLTLEEVAGRTEDEIRSLDGVGPKSFRRLRDELAQRGLTFLPGREKEEVA